MNINRIRHKNVGRVPTSMLRACLHTCGAIKAGILKAREKISDQYQQMFRGEERLLRLALNEAEALAWQTEYPHLLFPVLAFEKADTAMKWRRRQRTIQGEVESAFAA